MEKKRIMHRLEEVILILIIILNILDFFEILPADIDFAKKIISWTALGYILYKASLTKIFFNNQKRSVDILLIISYFMLIFKNIIIFSSGIIDEFFVFYDFQKFILNNSPILEFYSLIIGSILILILAIYSSIYIDVKKPSLMHIIHEEGKPKTLYKYFIRIITVYLVYIAFFVVVFNFVMEWLAIAIDAPIIMIALLFYLFIVIRHYRKYNAESLIYRIGEFGEKFYEKLISLFHYKKTIFLGISGMIVLHLLTDAISFIIPYIFIFRDTLYFTQLGAGHDALLTLFLGQIKNLPFLEQFSLFFVYLLNLIGILFFLIMPSIFWYIAFTRKKFYLSKFKIGLIFSSILVFILAPVFNISRLIQPSILGVDIKTSFANNILYNNFFYILFFAFIFFLAVYFLSDNYRKGMIYAIILSSVIFFAYYIYLFFTSLIFYYTDIIRTLFVTSHFILSFYFLLFLTINILFYIAGSIMFINEIMKKKLYKNFL
ncbi:MAG: hypothetical protein IH934_00825 [Nanoarchaeota archaeon]|nr:hypothetical protein [Nanoarchaeota archaeon]